MSMHVQYFTHENIFGLEPSFLAHKIQFKHPVICMHTNYIKLVLITWKKIVNFVKK